MSKKSEQVACVILDHDFDAWTGKCHRCGITEQHWFHGKHLLYKATERYSYGWVSQRFIKALEDE